MSLLDRILESQQSTVSVATTPADDDSVADAIESTYREDRPVERESKPERLAGDNRLKAAGDFVHRNQTMDSRFRNVSTGWTKRLNDPADLSVMTFDDAKRHIAAERGNVHDFSATIDRFRPVVSGETVRIADRKTGDEYGISDFAMAQFAQKTTNVGKFAVENLAESDPDILATIFDRGFKRIDPEKPFLVRVRTDSNSIRAFLSSQYAIVDNGWFLDTLEELIPGGLVSHFRGDGDSIYFNVLIPDSIRTESDSDYGGMLASGNSEIGARRLSSLPSIFRAICMNGCIWGEKQGVSYVRKVHRGEIDLAELRDEIRANLDAQIPLLTTGIDSMLALREHETRTEPAAALAAALWETQRQTSKSQADAMLLAHSVERTTDGTSAFDIVNSVTRAAQEFEPAAQEFAESTAGRMLEFDDSRWDRVFERAETVTDKELQRVYSN